MTLRLVGGAEFLHIPKTGGTWVTSTLYANKLVANSIGHKHADFDCHILKASCSGRDHLKEVVAVGKDRVRRAVKRSAAIEKQGPVRFCFVRNPLSWYESWWKYMQGRGWNDWGKPNSAVDWHPNSILNGLGSDDFNEFVWNVVKTRPGYVTELFFSYVKPGLHFIGKTERLRDDLAYVLDQLGQPYNRELLLASRKKNVSTTAPSKVQWDSKLRDLVTRLEINALIHFDYLSEQEKHDFGVGADLKPVPGLIPDQALVAGGADVRS